MKKFLILFIFIISCSTQYNHTPNIDSRGSAMKGADMKRYHDDLSTCQEIANKSSNKKKNIRILTENCMEGRGYVVLDKGL